MEELRPRSSMETIAHDVCRKEGHFILTIEGKKNLYEYCQKCGMTAEEIRGLSKI